MKRERCALSSSEPAVSIVGICALHFTSFSYFGQGNWVCHYRGRRTRTFVSSLQVSESVVGTLLKCCINE